MDRLGKKKINVNEKTTKVNSNTKNALSNCDLIINLTFSNNTFFTCTKHNYVSSVSLIRQ